MSNRRYAGDEAPDFTTWDGTPVAVDPPHGATIVCWRVTGGTTEVLFLHRAHEGPDFEGDWAWTPPSGARMPGEDVFECARRELLEETGIALELQPVDTKTDWAVFMLEIEGDQEMILDAEHDRHEWVELQEAILRCKPLKVADAIRLVAGRMRPAGR